MTLGSLFSVKEALAHLRRKDAVLKRVIAAAGDYTLTLRGDPYLALIRTILHQQLGGAAAAAIERRFYALYNDKGEPPAPLQLLESSDEFLRTAGLSRQKSGYLRDLALHIVEGKLNFADMDSLSDDEVTQRLVAVHGLGEWSAHMFLMFHLGRPDVLPVGDLGVRNGMRIAYRLDAMPTPKQAKEIGAPWAPYRSVGSWYMWRVTEPESQDI